jgi:hypothetical protein
MWSASAGEARVVTSPFGTQHSAFGIRVRAVTLGVMTIVMATGVLAHHGSAEYDVTREVTLRGRIAEFRWVNPHVRIVVETQDGAGTLEMWDCEGPPLTWAAQRGWTAATLRQGETISVVMYPPKQMRRTGLVKRIERANGDVLLVSRPWLDRG